MQSYLVNRYILGIPYVPECIGSKNSIVGKIDTVYHFNNTLYVLHCLDLD